MAGACDERSRGHGIAHGYDRFGAVTRALVERERHLGRRWQFDDRRAAGPPLVRVEHEASRETWIARPSRGTRLAVAQRRCGCRPQFDAVDGAGRQAKLAARALRGDHRVHLPGAPTIASTGHAGRQRAQPMHFSSSIHATCAGFGAPNAGSSGRGARSSSAASARTVCLTTGRAAVDVRLAAGYRGRIGTTAGIQALAALRLRQQCIDLLDERIGIGFDP